MGWRTGWGAWRLGAGDQLGSDCLALEWSWRRAWKSQCGLQRLRREAQAVAGQEDGKSREKGGSRVSCSFSVCVGFYAVENGVGGGRGRLVD